MMRKECYATSGTRMTVRFFGGWDFNPDDAKTIILPQLATGRVCRWAVT